MAKVWPVVAVGAVVWRGPEEILLIRRGQPPNAGEWSIPGGRVEAGETMREALARELKEETGLSIALDGLIDVVDLVERNQAGEVAAHFVLIDFSARWLAGEARAGSDASECVWLPPAEALARLRWEQTRRILRMSARQLWELEI